MQKRGYTLKKMIELQNRVTYLVGTVKGEVPFNHVQISYNVNMRLISMISPGYPDLKASPRDRP